MSATVRKFTFCQIYTVFVGNLLAHKNTPYAVCWKASKTFKTLISKRRTLGDIAIRLTYRTTRLKVNTDSPRDNQKFD